MEKRKRNNTTLYIVFALVLVLIGVVIAFGLSQKRVSWSMTYLPEDENPYGTKILYNLVKETRSAQPFVILKDSVAQRLPVDPTPQCDNYFYIGDAYYGDSADISRLLDFVRNGNNAFIFCNDQGNLLFDSLIRAPKDDYYDYDMELYDEYYASDQKEKRVYHVSDTNITVYLNDNFLMYKQCDVAYKFNYENVLNEWNYFKDSLLTYDNHYTQHLGSFDEEYNNYIQMNYGNGRIFFHSTPIVFTNYFMLNDTAMNYCRSALQTFGDGMVYWDEDNRTYDYNSLGNTHGSPGKPGEGPLEFILSEPDLRIAWYLLMLSAILYLIFGAKRKQRIIRASDKMENTSIEYAEVLSQMFMKQKDHKKLVLMKMDLLKAFIRDRIGIRLPINIKDEDEKLYKEISQKSAVNFELIKDIFEHHKYLSSILAVETPDMLDFHRKIEQFYTTCK